MPTVRRRMTDSFCVCCKRRYFALYLSLVNGSDYRFHLIAFCRNLYRHRHRCQRLYRFHFCTVSNSLAGPVHNVNTGLNYCTIQSAIDDPLTLNGHVISVDAGTYAENVVVSKSLTILRGGCGIDQGCPCFKNPNCGGGGGGSLCSGASNVFFVRPIMSSFTI